MRKTLQTLIACIVLFFSPLKAAQQDMPAAFKIIEGAQPSQLNRFIIQPQVQHNGPLVGGANAHQNRVNADNQKAAKRNLQFMWITLPLYPISVSLGCQHTQAPPTYDEILNEYNRAHGTATWTDIMKHAAQNNQWQILLIFDQRIYDANGDIIRPGYARTNALLPAALIQVIQGDKGSSVWHELSLIATRNHSYEFFNQLFELRRQIGW